MSVFVAVMLIRNALGEFRRLNHYEEFDADSQ